MKIFQALRGNRVLVAKPVDSPNTADLDAALARCQALEEENTRLISEAQQFSALRTPISPALSNLPAFSPLPIPDDFRPFFKNVLLRTFYRADVTQDESFERDLDAHVVHRFRDFEYWICTWLAQIVPDMSKLRAIEIGSGTGSSTLAVASRVKSVVSFEIDRKASAAAAERLRFFGYDNVQLVNEKLTEEKAQALVGQIDLVVLCAVLEHMTYVERIEALRASWKALAPGGLLAVADTPNRFNVLEDHTSLMHFYSALPLEIQRDYAQFSPRADFRNSIGSTAPEKIGETLARWGFGISYHDFELAIGRNCHDYIVLDGYEEAILARFYDRTDDALLRLAFDRYNIPAHRAFTRHNLHFVMRKPAHFQ
ncbi:bifunctional 2-polyprenyl-6-hydroxyphenol methylase/3-demethylubiquinol 3-O-methyltransferase UbiG [Caballeronia sp. INML1]|uniref:class I SAM-dependent methyltransferase n=1 Tax=Caballeronia sp. INML1 TaxID=2921760 RepID=UPI002028FFAB|nr:class I SAM-dependent methyltransferase [Caballeronia sp. INML1]